MRYMGGEGRDEARTGIQPPRHCQKTLRQAGELGRAMALEWPQRVAVALADQVAARDQLPHRPGDGAVKQNADQQRRHDRRKDGENEFLALLIEVFEDITW